jgi:O-antigen ligase
VSVAIRLASVTVSGGILLVMLLFAPALEAPFLVPKFAALELAASLGFVAYALARATTAHPMWTGPLKVGVLLVLATTLVAWLAAASRPLGAPYAVAAVVRWGSLLGVACGASVLADSPDARDRALQAVTVAVGAVAAIGLLQHLDILPLPIPVISMPGSTFGNRNLAAEVMAMGLPLALGAAAGTRRPASRATIVALLALELVFLAATRARAAWLGAACGLGTTVVLVRPRWSRRSLAIVGAAFFSALVVASIPGRYNPRDAGDRKRYAGVMQVLEEGFDARSTALRTRFGLWRRTLSMIRDEPVLGVGPGNWPVVFPRYAEPRARLDGVLSATLAPRQAHDDLLERAAETGLLGTAALVALVAAAATAARRRLLSNDQGVRAVAAGASGALVALVAISLAGFPLEMPGTLALSGLALGFVATDPQAKEGGSPSTTSRGLAWVGVALGAMLFGAAATRAERSVRGSAWLARAEEALHRNHDSIGAAEAMGAINFALQAQPSDYRARLRSAQMMLRERRAAESARAARRAIDLEPYAPNAWAVLAAAELDGDDADAAGRDATHALALLHDYPFALHTRALAAERRGDTAAADRAQLRALATGPANDDTARAARALTESGDLPP